METIEQRINRNKQVRERQKADIERGGNCRHEVTVIRSVGWPKAEADIGETEEAVAPVVQLTNNGDDHYAEIFRNRGEVTAFIIRLDKAAEEAWGRPRLYFDSSDPMPMGPTVLVLREPGLADKFERAVQNYRKAISDHDAVQMARGFPPVQHTPGSVSDLIMRFGDEIVAVLRGAEHRG